MNRRGFFSLMAMLACGSMPAPCPGYAPIDREELIAKIRRAVACTPFSPPLGSPRETVLLISNSVYEKLASCTPNVPQADSNRPPPQ
jgi:hypothetical protein